MSSFDAFNVHVCGSCAEDMRHLSYHSSQSLGYRKWQTDCLVLIKGEVIAVLAVELDVNGTKLLCHACSYYYVVKHKVRVSVA
jgi:hypothetical protein